MLTSLLFNEISFWKFSPFGLKGDSCLWLYVEMKINTSPDYTTYISFVENMYYVVLYVVSEYEPK